MAIKIRIQFTDGTGEVVDYAEKVKVVDGVLRAWSESSYGGVIHHIGSWPLVNVRKWTTEQL